MTDTIKGAIWGSVISAIITSLASLLIFFLGNFSTQDTIVESLSVYFNFVDENMSYEQALQTIYQDSRQKDEEIEQLNQQVIEKNEEISQMNQQNNELRNQMASMPNVEYKAPALISDGLKIQDSVNKSIIVVDNNIFYSDNIINLILKNKLIYKPEQNIVFYDDNGENISSETKIDLFDTNVLYDGVCYGKYLPSDGKTISMGSNTYNKGFVIYDDHSLFGDGDGYALFDLQGKYSKMTFEVGRTNEYEKQDVTLKVYLNNEYVEEYSLSAQTPPVQLTINLNYANDMRIELTGGSRVKYGFVNVILHY